MSSSQFLNQDCRVIVNSLGLVGFLLHTEKEFSRGEISFLRTNTRRSAERGVVRSLIV